MKLIFPKRKLNEKEKNIITFITKLIENNTTIRLSKYGYLLFNDEIYCHIIGNTIIFSYQNNYIQEHYKDNVIDEIVKIVNSKK